MGNHRRSDLLCGGLAILSSAFVGACETNPFADALGGELRVALTQAPADVQCIRLRVTGTRTVERRLHVDPGDETVFVVTGLPLGNVLVEAEAFDESCAPAPTSEPGWVAAPVGAILVAGRLQDVSLPMRRNSQATFSFDFEDEPQCRQDGAVCSAYPQCCSLNCQAGVCEPAPSCAPGLTHCAQGECVDLLTDAENCGACFESCGEAACDQGICEPLPTGEAIVVINEVAPADPTDWIEITNIGAASAALAGWSLTDSDPLNLYTFGDVSVAPGEHLVLLRDATGSFTFSLGTSADAVHLYDAEGAPVDSTSWTSPAADAPNSWGRFPDGTGPFSTRTTPTQGAANQ